MYILSAILPAAVVSGLLWGAFRCTPFDFGPFYSDELAYWHETSTFTAVGFAGGNYTVEEALPPLRVVSFGPHGPAFPILYGVFGSLVGWCRNSAVLFNLVGNDR